jgi:hypothetical protein
LAVGLWWLACVLDFSFFSFFFIAFFAPRLTENDEWELDGRP